MPRYLYDNIYINTEYLIDTKLIHPHNTDTDTEIEILIPPSYTSVARYKTNIIICNTATLLS